MAETLADFLRESADRFGNRPAVLFKPGFRYQRWSYARLWEESGRVATLLQKHGLTKGDRALIWAPNAPHWVLAFFGCMRAGVIAVPADMRSAPDFVERIVAKSRPSLAFVSRATPVGEGFDVPSIRFEELYQLVDGLPEPAPVDIAGSDVAEVMFTSGTTGDPKGVMLTHRNILADLEAVRHYIPGKPSYRLVSLLPLSHMFEQIGGLFLALACGANVTYPASRQPVVWVKTMQERKVTTLLLVPQGLELFMNTIEREVRRQGKERSWRLLQSAAGRSPRPVRRLLFRRVHRRFGGHLDFVVSGGSALDPVVGKKWELMGVHILQGYGATEASPVIAVHPLDKPRYDNVGPALPGVDVRIAADGEVLVRGPNIMAGYWEAPEQTAAVFDGDWYKTGDLGFVDAGGHLHLRGRKKDMIVPASGMNVYPEDVEAALRKHPSVTDAAVVGLPRNGDVEVHAVLVLSDAAAADEAVAAANERLADHQRIRGFTVWPDEDFPRTHTLKVKKNVLVDTIMGRTKPAPTADVQASRPGSAVSRTLEQVIAEVARVPVEAVTGSSRLVGDLNLDSLGRIELVSAIEGDLGVVIDESELERDLAVSELRALVDSGIRSDRQPRFPRWGMRLWCRALRGTIQRSLVFPLLALTYHVRVEGREHLRGLDGPVLLAANHHFHFDNGVIIKTLPRSVRRHLAIAAWDHLWRNPVWAVVNPLVGNGFPFAKDGPVRPSLENLGRIVDDGWSVLIYPEGELTVGGPLKPFKAGTGLLAVEGGLPVVPVRLDVRRLGTPWQLPFLRRGELEVRFGAPLRFQPGTSYREATEGIEAAVQGL